MNHTRDPIIISGIILNLRDIGASDRGLAQAEDLRLTRAHLHVHTNIQMICA